MSNKKLSKSEEDYIKTIFNLSEFGNKQVSTNSISKVLKIEPASVTDMVKKLSLKKLIYHKKYKGSQISKSGIKVALQIIRKHRLWEVFLHEKLNFKWDKIHNIAEELEHVTSNKLIDKLDDYLKYPKIDPHGDPIPNKLGVIKSNIKISLSDLKIFESGIVSRIIKEDDHFFKLLKLTDDPISQFNLNSMPLSTSLFVLFKTISFSNLKFGMPYINKPPARS